MADRRNDQPTRTETIRRLLEEVDLWISTLDDDQYEGVRQMTELEGRIDRARDALRDCEKQHDVVRDYLDAQIEHAQNLAEAISSLGYHVLPDDDSEASAA